MRRLLAFVALAACKGHETPAPTPTPTPAPAPAPPAPAAPLGKLTFSDFWTLAGVTRTDTPETVIQKWGKPDQQGDDGDGGQLVRYLHGPAITFRSDKAIQIDFAVYGDEDLSFAKAHPDPKLSLLGMACDEAASHLAFTDKIEDYTTCKHYDPNGWLVDFTAMCARGKLTSLVVVWYPLGDIAGQPLPPDHCGLPKD